MGLEVGTLTLSLKDLNSAHIPLSSSPSGSPVSPGPLTPTSSYGQTTHILRYPAPYVRVTQYNYARIAPDSPGRGACTSHVASGTVVVLHSPTTGRSTLSHAPNFMYITSFIPLIDWVTGGTGFTRSNGYRDAEGPGGDEEPTKAEQEAFCEGAGARPCVLNALILRGYAYARPGASRFNHSGWIRDFRGFFGAVARTRGIALSIDDDEKVLRDGAVCVDKGSGRITRVELGEDVRRAFCSSSPDFAYAPDGPRKDGYGFGYESARGRVVLSLESHLPALAHTMGAYTHAQEQQDLFVGALLNARRTPEPTPLRLQFDGYCYRLPHSLSDEARLLIRSKRLNEHPSRQSAIVRAFGFAEDWIAAGAHSHHHDYYNGIESESNIGFQNGGGGGSTTDARVLRSLLTSTAHDRSCELCSEEATKTCSACMGAWYCGDAHQRRDWKAHKVWCRAHTLA